MNLGQTTDDSRGIDLVGVMCFYNVIDIMLMPCRRWTLWEVYMARLFLPEVGDGADRYGSVLRVIEGWVRAAPEVLQRVYHPSADGNETRYLESVPFETLQD